MWVFPKDDTMPKPKRITNREKFLWMMIWNPHALHVADRLPDGAKFNIACFPDGAVTSLQLRMFSAGRKQEGRKLSSSLRDHPVHRLKGSL
jgi:hypothetical protein